MLPVNWTARARLGVAEIVDYVAASNPIAAKILEDRIIGAVARLPQYPSLYRPGRLAGTRELVVDQNYVVVTSLPTAQSRLSPSSLADHYP